FTRHWGAQIVFQRDNSIGVSMVFQGLNRQQAASVWRPFLDWVAGSAKEFSMERPVMILDVPARHFWNAEYIKENLPAAIVSDNRLGATEGNFFWAGDGDQVGQVLHGYKSAWVPASLLRSDQQARLVDALLAFSRYWNVSLHFNKGLAGAPAEELAAARNTATNPAVLDAFA